ncbi:efflux RND transporter permease subunit [Motilimonas sp. 1_MG-2023]|uniref:efflux RND transporter permease subunit n=1 Tax=Motilimonas sp. 1_MG-2023 TaxID=3062672 RepID=UPI0026E1D6D3|nr:efflux RND transporter permease subunit [Motilimonas sp. 1_MG-2023]MDO6526739.1 efflux RND transporter permease subunit [Motilimonas sp. 1_MG-2023]
MLDTNKGIIAWFARNSVAANLLMIMIIVGGLLTAGSIRKQFFPQVEVNWIKFNAVLPGAAPQEVEEGILIKFEDALEQVQGLERVIAYADRGYATSYIEVNEEYDATLVLDEVKAAIDSVSNFPAEMESKQIERIKMRQDVMYISLYGDLAPRELKQTGKLIYDEIRQLPGVSITEFYGGLDDEISITVSKDKLREYGLTFNQVARAVQRHSGNMSAGGIRSENGYINLRVANQAYGEADFAAVPLLTHQDGSLLTLGDVAQINDGLEEGMHYSRFNGKNSVTFYVGAAADQSLTAVADTVKNYLKTKQASLPQGLYLEPWIDMTYYLEGRLALMLDSMQSGAVLVFLMLALFLRVRLAFWVMMGLPVCFLGTLLFMPMSMIDVTINVVSLFAFILVLGVVVDDAIVMGESAHSESSKYGQNIDSVISGVKRVAMPATFGVLTTIAAFLPLVLDDGPSAAFGQAIGFVVILCLLFSLVESKLILPAHLAAMKSPTVVKSGSKNPLDWLRLGVNYLQAKVDSGLTWFIQRLYRPCLARALSHRYTLIMLFISLILVCAGLYQGGLVRFVGQPKIPHDFPTISLTMNVNASEQATLDMALKIEQALYQVDRELEAEFGQGMISDMQVDLRSRTEAEVLVRLVLPELRPMDTFAVAQRWHKAIPPLPGMKTLTIQDNLFGNDRDDGDISFRLQGSDQQQLDAVVAALKQHLNSLAGVGNVNDSSQSHSQEVQFSLKPQAHSLGLSLADIAAQVNQSFYGLEVQRIIRGGDEVKVMLRYPEFQRNSISQVDKVLIQTETGVQVPLSEVAQVNFVDGMSQIRRENGSQTVSVWASIDASQVEPFKLAQDVRDNFIPKLLLQYPRVSSEMGGKVQLEIGSANEQLRNFALSMLLVYSLLAVPLKSYAQPLIIMSVIPFGIIGSVAGHQLMGIDLSSLSLFGIIAAAGVVVNDSLVLVDHINKTRDQGKPLHQVVLHSGCRRFRAILLTSLTTFIGLMPIMMETSMQAQMVIPMAVSLAYGVLFSTVVTLFLIPSLYLMIDDIQRVVQRIRGKKPAAKPAPEPLAE